MVDLARPGPGDAPVAPDGRETHRRTLRAVEDDETDLELLLYELGRCGVPTDTTWVVDAAGLRSALRSPADLVIAIRIVRGQGGDLAVTSSPDGTVVRLCLPAEQAVSTHGSVDLRSTPGPCVPDSDDHTIMSP